MRVLLSIVLAAAATLLPRAAAADEQGLERQAEERFQAGERHFREGRFEEAAGEYLRAFELVGIAELLFNAAQAYRRAGADELARHYYQKFIDLAPDHPAVVHARRFLSELEPAGDPDAGTGEPDVAATLDPGADGGGRVLRLAGIAFVGAGLVGIGVGAKFGLDARAASSAIGGHQEGPWDDELLDRQEAGRRAQRRMLLFTVSGAAALALGSGLYLLGRRHQVIPHANGSGVGVALGGSF